MGIAVCDDQVYFCAMKNLHLVNKKSYFMMCFKKLLLLPALITGVCLFSSCEKEKIDESVTLSIQATSQENVIDYTEFTLQLKELRTMKSVKKKLTDKGACELTLNKGTYTISIEWKNGNASFFGTMENYSVTKSETLNIPLTRTISQPTGIIFKEIFFNGETNSGKMMHPDQYFVLYNNGDATVYADGITFAVSLHANWSEADVFTELLPGEVVAAQFYSIPGNGLQYPLKPGDSLVIARTAINHHESYENAVDLSGADFEVYEPDMPAQFGTDVDNPDVPNLIAHFSIWGIFNMHPRGPLAPFIFKPETDMKTFMEKNKFSFKNKKGETQYTYKVPAGLIIDGIETGNEGAVKVKSLPSSVDKGYITVTGCHRQESIRRKVGANHKLIDTNNSSEDCVRVKGQTPHPKKGAKTKSGVVRSVVNGMSYDKEFPGGIQEFAGSSWNVLH